MTDSAQMQARVSAVHDDIVTIQLERDAEGDFYPVVKNEVVLICPRRVQGSFAEKLQAEVLRVRHGEADVQVFENTRGVAVGDRVELTGRMLSVALGPGLLGQVYDGLQNPLELIAGQHGFFLPRGLSVDGIDTQQRWSFVPRVKIGSRVRAGDLLGTVQEGRFEHRILAPFNLRAEVEVSWVQEGSFTVTTPVVRLKQADGREQEVCMRQFWPVRIPVNRDLLREGYSERLFPNQPLLTSIRLIDTFFPVARGGTACIPGPFGAGQDGAAEPDFTLLRCGYSGHSGLRRAGRGGGGNHHRIPQHAGSPWRYPDGSHGDHLQHLLHAGGGPGSLHLHRHHHQ